MVEQSQFYPGLTFSYQRITNGTLVGAKDGIFLKSYAWASKATRSSHTQESDGHKDEEKKPIVHKTSGVFESIIGPPGSGKTFAIHSVASGMHLMTVEDKKNKRANLTKVLEAIKSRQQIYPGSRDNLTLFIDRGLGPGDERYVEELQDHLERKFDVFTEVSGGGSGCSKVILNVKGKSLDEAGQAAFNLLKRIAEDPETRELFLKKDVSIAISSVPYARYETRS